MDTNGNFLNEHWLWPIFLGAIALWMVFVWKEWPFRDQRRFYIKLVVALLGILALATIALGPLLPVKEQKARSVLLTQGYRDGQLDSLRKVYRKLKVLRYRPNAPLFVDGTPTAPVFVLGNGLETYDLWQMDRVPGIHLPGEPPKGVLQFTYDPEVRVGDRLWFHGRYANTKKGHRLVLQGPGGIGIDSVPMIVSPDKKFRFVASPKVAGNFLFSLVEKDTLGAIMNSDPIPLMVRAKKPLEILVVNGFPTFGTKYLKNYLAESGHRLVVRSKLTKGRFKNEYFNRDPITLGSLSQKGLEPFDLLVMDANSYGNLGAGERSAVENSIRKNGLGLFVQPEPDFFMASDKAVPFGFVSDGNTTTALDGNQKLMLEKYGFRFKRDFQLQPIHKIGETYLSAYKRLGLGRMGSTVLANTYGLLLDGKTEQYQELWSQIVAELAKREALTVQWDPSDPWAYKDRPFSLHLWTSFPKPLAVSPEGIALPLEQDPDLEQLWKGINYPREIGWHTHYLEQDTVARFQYYVMDSSKWKSMATYTKLQENQRYFQGTIEVGKGAVGKRPISPIWAFLVFMGCMAYLWLEPKLFGQ
jgi:hypothetical protein